MIGLAPDDRPQGDIPVIGLARARVSEGDKGGAAARACLDIIAMKRRLHGLSR